MKKLLIGCALAVPAVAGLMTLSFAPKAEAAPPQTCELDYYTDNTYTELAGGGYNTCSGTWALTWGVRTSYFRILTCSPC